MPITSLSWNCDFKSNLISTCYGDITHRESVQPMTEETAAKLNPLRSLQVVTLVLSIWTPPARSHTVLTSTSREMTFKFQTVKKKKERKLTNNFSLGFLLLKNCTRLLQKSIISYTYLYDNIVYVILL